MRVILFGATGMVGEGVLIECLEDPAVASVLVVGRRSCGVVHPKVRELLRKDFFDWSEVGSAFVDYDACFFCLGVSAAEVSEADYVRLTEDLTLAAGRAIVAESPDLTFCYVSGEGTDSTERGRMMWARVKGKTENALLAMFAKAFMFRPGYIHPRKGVRSPRRLYRAFHLAIGPFWPLMRRAFSTHVTTTENMGLAMLSVVKSGYSKRVLENEDINRLGESS